MYADNAAPTARADVSRHVHVLAQRLYGVISAVIAGNVDPGYLISVLEDFLLLDVCNVRVAYHFSNPGCPERSA